jgi:hypothetical protein
MQDRNGKSTRLDVEIVNSFHDVEASGRRASALGGIVEMAERHSDTQHDSPLRPEIIFEARNVLSITVHVSEHVMDLPVGSIKRHHICLLR